MAKKKKKSAKATAFTARPATMGKSKQELVQEVYDDELKDAVKTYIQNTIDKVTVGKDPIEAEQVFLTSLKRIRDTQARVLQLLEEN